MPRGCALRVGGVKLRSRTIKVQIVINSELLPMVAQDIIHVSNRWLITSSAKARLGQREHALRLRVHGPKVWQKKPYSVICPSRLNWAGVASLMAVGISYERSLRL